MEILKEIGKLANQAYAVNKAKGYCKGIPNIPRELCLIHSEVSEALEALRGGEHCSKNISLNFLGKVLVNEGQEAFREVYKREVKGSFEEELADIVIRTMSLAKSLDIDLEAHIQAKIWYNKTTPAKAW